MFSKILLSKKNISFFLLVFSMVASQVGCEAQPKAITGKEIRNIVAEELDNQGEVITSAEMRAILSESFMENDLIDMSEDDVLERLPGDSDTGRDNYESLQIEEELGDLELSLNDSPVVVAKKILEDSNSYATDDCFNLEQVAIHGLRFSQDENVEATTAVIHTYFGRCDDSNGGFEKRIDFANAQQDQWEIVWIGERNACNRINIPWASPGNFCP